MENIQIDGTPKTPTVTFSKDNGVLEIRGRSIPENSIEFYKPLIDWIEAYGKSPKGDTMVNIKLEYFNTSSSKCILDVFKKLETVSGTNMTINWYYEEDDEDMLEAGEDYQAIINIPFKMIEVAELD
ncbi:MAG: DUF1987 domain-containing protein [Flavobacteriales bacterium]|nr:DUF1987 domain-containing protein [Flavobacteriales bacterium]HRJ35511.1 DUF1987 domain-containing protein [Flavobacteriales bacterium]HRJ38824.1 DUF1987 domain-containing protein [Flavobacteriales bacterium]